jgi:hypothetical protein
MVPPLGVFAHDVLGGAIAFCGHFLPEDQPAAVARELIAFSVRGDDLTFAR